MITINKQTVTRALYGVVIVAGIAGLSAILLQNKHVCVKSEKVCFSYHSDWKIADTGTSPLVRLTKAKPGAIFQLVVDHHKMTGSVQSVATVLDDKLKKQMPGYKLISSNQVVVGHVLAVEMNYEFTPQAGGRAVRQQLIAAPIGDITYLYTTETSIDNFAKVSSEFDYFLSRVEISK